MTGQRLNVAVLQMDVAIGEPERNFANVAAALEEAVGAPDKPDVLLLPEMWNAGYALDRIGQLADVNGARTRTLIAEFSRMHGVHVIAGSVASKRDGGGVRNTIYAFDRDGRQTAEYSKIHLFRLMDEEKHLESGDTLGRFDIEGTQAGMMICYDIRFPELARTLALDGAKVLFVPAQWPKPRLNHWRTLLMARAIENQMYIVACNRVGISGTTDFFGHSMIIDPWGEVIAEGGEEQVILTAELDLAKVDEVRGKIPVFADRRPGLYSLS